MRNYSDEEIQTAELKSYKYQEELEKEQTELLRLGVQRTIGEIVEANLIAEDCTDEAIELNKAFDAIKSQLVAIREDSGIPENILLPLLQNVFGVMKPKVAVAPEDTIIQLHAGHKFQGKAK